MTKLEWLRTFIFMAIGLTLVTGGITIRDQPWHFAIVFALVIAYDLTCHCIGFLRGSKDE